jgi:hypothetical protein
MEKYITIIKFQFYSKIICCNAITCAITQCMAIIKTKITYNLCLWSSIMCNKSKKRKENKKIKKKKKEKKKRRPKVNLILSHVNHAFLILNLQIGPKAFKHTCCTIEKKRIFNVKKGPIQSSICFKLVLGLLVPKPPCLKWPLISRCR